MFQFLKLSSHCDQENFWLEKFYSIIGNILLMAFIHFNMSTRERNLKIIEPVMIPERIRTVKGSSNICSNLAFPPKQVKRGAVPAPTKSNRRDTPGQFSSKNGYRYQFPALGRKY